MSKEDWSDIASPVTASMDDWSDIASPVGKKKETSSAARRIADVPLGIAKGIADLPGAAVGLLDIPTNGLAGKAVDAVVNPIGEAADAVGVPNWARPTQLSNTLGDLYSPEMKQAKQNVHEAFVRGEQNAADAGGGTLEKFIGGIAEGAPAFIKNPAAAVALATENYGGMKAIAKGTAKMLAPAAAKYGEAVKAGTMTQEAADAALANSAGRYSAVNEGLLTAGQNTQQVEHENPDASFADRAMQGVAGAITGGISRGVSKIPRLGDVEANMALRDVGSTAKTGLSGGRLAAAGKSAFSEGVLEELPQSMQEQVWQNLGTNKPWDSGLAEQAVSGLVAGGAMGGAMGALSAKPGAEKNDSPIVPIPKESINLVTDPDPLQERIDSLLGIGNKPMNDTERTQYAKDLESAFGEVVGHVSGKDGLEIPVTMEDYLRSQLASADITRDRPKAENAVEQSANRLQQLADEESTQQPDIAPPGMGIAAAPIIPVVGALSAAANLAVQTGAHASAVAQQAAAQAAQNTTPEGKAGTPAEAQPNATAPASGTLAGIAAMAPTTGGQTNAASPAQVAKEAPQANAPKAGATAAQATSQGQGIDLSNRTHAQLNYLSKNGKNGHKEAAIAELQRRGKIDAPKASAVSESVPALKAEDSADRPNGDGYEQRNASRVSRINKANTQEEFDAITAEEHSDGERHFEGTERVRSTINDRKFALKIEAAKNVEASRYEAGDWVSVSEHGSRSAAEQEAKDLQRKDPSSEYRLSIGQNDGWSVRKRKKPDATVSKTETVSEQAPIKKTDTEPSATDKPANRIRTIDKWTAKELQDRLDRGNLTPESEQRLRAELAKRPQPKQSTPQESPLMVGKTPHLAEPVTVRNGVVWVGEYPAIDYDTEADITVPDGATPQQIIDSLRHGGALGSRKVFGLKSDSAQTEAQPPSASPQHVENGKAESATAAVVVESLKKGAANSPLDLRQERDLLLQKVDQAIAAAPTAEEKDAWDSVNQKIDLTNNMHVADTIGYRVFDVPGDGKFKVLNLKEALQRFRERIDGNPGFSKPRTPSPQTKADWQKTGRGGTEATIKEFIDDGELLTAVEYAKQIGKPLVFGQYQDGSSVTVYTDSKPFEHDGYDDFKMVSARAAGAADKVAWAVIDLGSGMTVSSKHPTRMKAIAETHKALAKMNAEQLATNVKSAKANSGFVGTQEELEQRWVEWVAKQEELHQAKNEQEQSQPKPQGVQTGLVTADGRVSSEAKTESANTSETLSNEMAGFTGVSDAEYDLRKLSRAEKRDGDIELGNGKFVTLEQAVEAAKKSMDPADWSKPFQFNRVLDIAPIDWNTMVGAMKNATVDAKKQEEAKPSANEPWQMTRKEWYDAKNNDRAETFGSSGKRNGAAETAARIERKARLNYGVAENGEPVDHRQVIEKAIADGKQIPDEVLADYPDLKESGIALLSPSLGRVDANKVDIAVASKVVADLLSGWRNAPDSRVVATFDDLPAAVRKEIEDQGEKTARGVFHGDTFYLIADEHASANEIEETIFHEVWAHYGLRSMLGANTTRELAGVFDQISASGIMGVNGKDAFRAFARRNGFNTAQTESMLRKAEAFDPRFTEAMKKRILVEELIAKVQEKGDNPSLKRKAQEIIGAIREWLRKVGFSGLMKYSDADLMRLVQKARDTVKYGKRGSSGKGDVPSVLMTAWHGSPHDHDKFDSSKIGTGEGAQAYGYGHYFAGAKDVAEWYRRKLSGADNSSITFNGKQYGDSDAANRKLTNDVKKWAEETGRDPERIDVALEYLAGMAGDLGSARQLAAKEGLGISHWIYGTLNDLSEHLYPSPNGRLYQVELAPTADEYLDWDKPLSEQSEFVRNALTDKSHFIGEYLSDTLEIAKNNGVDFNERGDTLYKIVSDQYGSDKAASDYLHSIGIRGIRYLDGSSRSAGEGNSNYVIFNDADVSITAKYNKAGKDKLTPADKAIYGMAADGKSAAEILKFIASASRNPFYRQLAKLLMKTGITPSITVGDGKGWKMNAGEGNKYAAGYNPTTNTVSLFRPASAERNMMHELVHAATLKALSGKGMASAQMNALYQHVKKSGKLKGMYGMSDVDEFIAEAFSNPKFQAALKQVSAAPVGGKPSSAWDWFVRVVRGILGLKQGADNALSKALEIGVGVMRENMEAATPDTQTGYAGARGSEMQERPSVRAVTGSMAEPAQSKVGAGGKTNAIAISDSVQASAIKAAQKVQDESNAFDLEEEIKSVSENGESDLSSLIANPKYWDAENEEFTDEGYKQVDLMNEQKARDNLRLLSITDLSDLDSAYHKAQYAAMVSILDGMGIEYKDTSSNSSKYLEVGRLKLRFANHANTTRSVMAQVSNMDEVTSLINVAPGEYKFAEALDAVMLENMKATAEAGGTHYAEGQKQTDTTAFRKWFGDSKVVDANGDPLVVYHGTGATDISEFKVSTSGTYGGGIYLTPEIRGANDYAIYRGAPSSTVYPVYAAIKNPASGSEAAQVASWKGEENAREELIKRGYDGVVDMRSGEIVAFYPEQIKSAIGNNGEFDPSNPDIRYNVADEGWSVSEQAKKVVMRLAGRPMADPSDPFAAENSRLREQDQSLWSKAKKQLRRYLAPGGLLPQSVFAEKIKRDSEFQAVEFDVRHLIGGLEQAVKADFGMAFDKLSKEKMRPITEALAGNVPASLPDATKTAAVAMRQYIDGMSTEYLKIIQQKIDTKMLKAIESGKDSDKAQAINEIELFEKIKGNIGRYVHRSYQAFDDPKWFEKVPAPVLNASRLYLKQGYMEAGETDAKAAQLAEVTLHEILKNGTAYDSMESFIAESKLGAKDLSVLMRRKEVPTQIRALLGEYQDARLNFTKSATKMGRLIWNTRFLDRVRDIGIGSFFFEGKDRPPEATTQIAAGGSEVYAPLNGLWTFPEIAQSFKDALGKEQMSDLYRAIVRANGLVKYGKTILAPTTAMRNWQSAMFFSLANGHFDLTQMKKSISAFREQVSQKATGQDLKYLRHLKQLGVVYDTPYAGEMARLMEDARMDELLSSDKGDAVRWFRKANQLAQGFYTFGDDFWKIIGFENEKAGLMKAGLSLQEAEAEAAKRIRDTYPTYSMVGRGVQWLSRFPLAGTFVSFPAEIIRTSSNMLRTVVADLKSDNPKLRELGMKRAAGMAFVSAAFYGLAALSMAMAGVGDDEDEAIRDLAPEWQKNSTFLYLGRDEKGNLRYFDMSFLDPYGYWKRPITAILRNQPWEDSLASGLRGMLEPFLGADISAKAIFEAVANQKENGSKVYKEKDGSIDQAIDIADHLRKALQPGVVGNVERLVKAAGDVRKSSGQPYSMEDELVALAGWRATTIDPKTALYYRSFDFTDSISEARKTLTDTLRDANSVSPEDIKDAKARAASKQEQAFKEMSRLIGAAEAAGMSKMQIVQTMRLSNISQANIAALMRGSTPDVSITPQLAARAVRQASQMRGPEYAAEVFDRYRQAMAN